MPNPSTQKIETEFFRMLNRIVEPIVRKGIGSPRFLPSGLIVLETKGRKTGRRIRSPLAAIQVGEYVVVGTFQEICRIGYRTSPRSHARDFGFGANCAIPRLS